MGRVDEAHPELDRAPQDSARLRFVLWPAGDAGPRQAHRAEPEPVHDHVTAQLNPSCCSGRCDGWAVRVGRLLQPCLLSRELMNPKRSVLSPRSRRRDRGSVRLAAGCTRRSSTRGRTTSTCPAPVASWRAGRDRLRRTSRWPCLSTSASSAAASMPRANSSRLIVSSVRAASSVTTLNLSQRSFPAGGGAPASFQHGQGGRYAAFSRHGLIHRLRRYLRLADGKGHSNAETSIRPAPGTSSVPPADLEILSRDVETASAASTSG
jgi:hypothetical protein